jgi:hypothetical protein
MVGDINLNINREIRNPRVIGVIVGFVLVILGLGNAGGSVLVDAVLGLVGFAIMFASVAPKAFEHFVKWLTKEISSA